MPKDPHETGCGCNACYDAGDLPPSRELIQLTRPADQNPKNYDNPITFICADCETWRVATKKTNRDVCGRIYCVERPKI